MLFIFGMLSVLLMKVKLKHQKHYFKVENAEESSSDSTIMKREVPLKDELDFYMLTNQIKPETLKLLMPNMTEEPYERTLPSNHCCFNGGTCHVPTYERTDRFCTCPPNFKGRYCSEDVDECETGNACSRHEMCKNTYGSYYCTCEQGYIREGIECMRKISCYENPCLNFSDCVDTNEGGIFCICRLGFKGKRCELKVPECEDSSCNEDDICVAAPDGFQCLRI